MTTDLSIADWFEVIRAENHEIPGRHRMSRVVDGDWMDDAMVFEELVAILQVECLKQARRRAYLAED